MSYNGSGTFNINSTGQPVVAGTVITASAFNALTTDLATGLTTAITKDGQTTTTARITFAQGITSSLTTDSSSVSTGSIITAGGAGIAKNLYVGVNANVAGTLGVTGVATFSSAPIYSSLTASSAVATDASKGLVSVTNTGTGNNVLATAPTIASLNLTTALTLTGASGTAGQALTSGGSGVAPTWTTISSSPTAITNGTSNVTVNSSGGSITTTTNGTAAVTVDTSQNVGIGTSSPAAKLEVVAGTGSVGIATFRTGDATAANNAGGGFRAASSATAGSRNARMWLDADGANFAGSDYFYIDKTGNSGDVALIQQSNANMTFQTNGSERMRITSDGELLVGTTTNTSTAKVRFYKTGNRANIEAEQGDSGGYNFQSIAFSNGGTYYHCNFQEGATQRGSITSNGSSTTYATGSDYRLKDNIEPMTNSLQKVLQLKPSIWKWKSNGKNGEGFVAHELQEICPEAVIGQKDAADEDGKPLHQMVDTSFLVATLTAAIQELKAINDTQAETITALTARIVALENA
jgi:hypothetical protein